MITGSVNVINPGDGPLFQFIVVLESDVIVSIDSDRGCHHHHHLLLHRKVATHKTHNEMMQKHKTYNER